MFTEIMDEFFERFEHAPYELQCAHGPLPNQSASHMPIPDGHNLSGSPI